MMIIIMIDLFVAWANSNICRSLKLMQLIMAVSQYNHSNPNILKYHGFMHKRTHMCFTEHLVSVAMHTTQTQRNSYFLCCFIYEDIYYFYLILNNTFYKMYLRLSHYETPDYQSRRPQCSLKAHRRQSFTPVLYILVCR